MFLSFKFCSRLFAAAAVLAVLLVPARAEEGKLPGRAGIFQDSLTYGQTIAPSAHSDTNDSPPVFSYKLQGAPDETFRPDPPDSAGVYTVRVRFPETETHLEAQAQCDFTLRAKITDVRVHPDFLLPPKTYDGTTEYAFPGASPLIFTVEGSTQQPLLGRDYEIIMPRLLSPYADSDPESRNMQFTLLFKEGLFDFSPELPQEFSLHLDVLKAPLTIKALDQYRADGPQSDLNQVKIEGLADGDLLTEISVSLKEHTAALLPENPRIFRGSLDVTDQYDISFLPGTLITRASLEAHPIPREGVTYSGRPQDLLSFPGEASRGNLFYQVFYTPSQSAPEVLLSDWSEARPQGTFPGFYRIQFLVKGWELSDSEEHSLTLTLSPRPLYVKAGGQKIYDGTDALPFEAVTIEKEPETVLPGEEVIIRSIEGSRFSQTEPGENIRIIPGTVILSGRDAGNYTVLFEQFEGTILRKPVTVIPEDTQKAFGESDPVLSYRALGLLEGEQLEGNLSRSPGQDPGTYEIHSGSLTDENNPHYEIIVKPGDFTIHPGLEPVSPEAPREDSPSYEGGSALFVIAFTALLLIFLLLFMKKRP